MLVLLLQMMREANDKVGPQYQRMTWDALRKSLNGLINKVNVKNIKEILPEIFSEVNFCPTQQSFLMNSECKLHNIVKVHLVCIAVYTYRGSVVDVAPQQLWVYSAYAKFIRTCCLHCMLATASLFVHN